VYGRLAEKRRGHIADGLKSLDFALATIGYTLFASNQNGR